MQGDVITSIEESSPRYPGWRVLFASVVGMVFSPGPLFFGSLGLLAEALTAEYGWSRGQIMLGLTWVSVAAIPAMPLVGSLLDRYGARRVLLPSMLMLISILVVLPFAIGGLPSFYLGFMLAGLLTAGAQSVCYIRVLSTWFDRRRGIAIGLAASGIGIGYAVVPLIVQPVVSQFGWRAAYWVLALVVSMVSLPLLLWLLRERDRTTSPGSLRTQTVAPAAASLRQVLSRREFWIIAAGILLAAIAFNSMVPTLVALVKDRGMTAQQAAFAASVLGFTVAASRLVVGFLMDMVFAPRVATVVFGMASVGIGMLAMGASGPWIYVAAVLIGAGFGAETDLMGYLVTRYFGRELVGRAYGLALSFFLIGTGLGPYFAGLGYDILGSYGPLLLAYAVAGFVAAALFLLLGPYERAGQTAAVRQAASSPT